MYQLHTLGWHSFQQLCLTIAREILGQTLESFLDSNDAGMDGAFAGTWKPQGEVHEDLFGQFVIQCKFTSRADYSMRLSDVSAEQAKVRRLVEQGRCDSYVLMTNCNVSGKRANEIKDFFRSSGVKHIVVLGATWICQQIRESKRLRMLVPRVYGLGDLSQILDERAYLQGRAVLESMREDLGKTVVTSAYRRAAEAIDKHGFVLLIGEPAAGKTTIASLLAMAAVDQWNASLLKIDDPSGVVEHWNLDDSSQFFWIDDAFGVTQYEAFLVRSWNHIFPQIRTMLRQGARIVMTSRDYIYNRARQDLKEGAFPLLQESQVVIDVHGLAETEKQQILYNHLKLGGQPKTFREKVKSYLESIAAHERFIPETARRLADPAFTKSLHVNQHNLDQFVEKRELFLQEVLQNLDRHSKAALALIYMRNDRLESPIALRESEKQALDHLGSGLGDCVTALEALNGSLVQNMQASDELVWRFKHPTIGDAYASILSRSSELLGIYLQGSETEKLISQITCGNVGIQNAVVIPKSLFLLVCRRLDEISASRIYKDPWLAKWKAREKLQEFLARRCSKEFIATYLDVNPDLLEQVSNPGLLLNSVPEVDLAVRLHELGLLPEERRKQFVDTVCDYAMEGQDLYALQDPGIRSVFEGHEFDEFLILVRTKLLPRLRDVRYEWEGNHDSDMSPDDHMQPLLDSLEALKKHFSGDEEAMAIISREIEFANWWIGDHMPEEPPARPERKLGEVQLSNAFRAGRSIFDDIDA